MSLLQSLHAREILDSRGAWTVEVRAETADGTVAWVGVPQRKSVGSHEAVCVSPDQAVRNVQEYIVPALRGMDAEKQVELDARTCELDGTEDKSRLGANTTLGVSFACARAAAQASGRHF